MYGIQFSIYYLQTFSFLGKRKDDFYSPSATNQILRIVPCHPFAMVTKNISQVYNCKGKSFTKMKKKYLSCLESHTLHFSTQPHCFPVDSGEKVQFEAITQKQYLTQTSTSANGELEMEAEKSVKNRYESDGLSILQTNMPSY